MKVKVCWAKNDYPRFMENPRNSFCSCYKFHGDLKLARNAEELLKAFRSINHSKIQ